jgi:Na+/phosphate symporter
VSACTRRKLGVIVLGFGLMFYGLEAIDEAMKPLRDHEPFMHAMESTGQNCIGVALVLPFLPMVARLLERLIPDPVPKEQTLSEATPAQ